MASNSTNIHKLQQALNGRGLNILYNTTQFYSKSQKRPVTVYIIRNAYIDEDTGKTTATELFKSTSQIQILLFLRDLWYEVNGWEVPTDNEIWNKAKAQYYERQNKPKNKGI